MSDGIDLQDILRAGFFLTSRARHSFSPTAASQSTVSDSPVSAASSHIPRSFEKLARRRRSYPPCPFVEDEIDSVGKEFGSFVIPVVDEEPQSRGEIDQQPILLEVFEFNPERRYIHVPDLSNKPNSGAEIGAARKRAYKKAKSAKPTPPDLSNESKTAIDSAKLKERSGDKPNLGRRKSRQDLPRIETNLEDHETATSHHHRSKSCAAGARPNFTPSRHHHRHHHHHHHHHHASNDEFLSPRVSRHSPNGRSKAHHRYESVDHHRSSTPSGYGDKGESMWDGKRWRSLTLSIDGRSSPRFGTNSSPVSSSERPHDSRHRDGKRSPRSPRSNRRDSFGSPNRSRESDLGKTSSSHNHRQSSWSSVDAFLGKSRHRPYPLSTDDGRSSLGIPSDDIRVSRSPSRVRTMPITSAHLEGFSASEKPSGYQSFSSIPLTNREEYQDQKRVPLPYPDDDEAQETWFEGVSSSGIPRQLHPGASLTSMPHIPPVMEDTASAVDQENVSMDNPLEASSHFSDLRRENDGQILGLPSCSRTIPIAGLMDWITLPRTGFNICPDCFGDVFSLTQYRAYFQPMHRPMVDPVACDFGSSPWYRIAWLLTLKKQEPDLRLFYKVANALASTSSRPCPGPQSASEYWYIIKDPFTRRAVPDFTVCYECVKMVEALFPSLGDIFGPLDAWQEPTISVCALHFAPDRKQFVLYFDAIETTAELAYRHDRLPSIGDLCMTLNRIGTFNECRESRRVYDGYWYSLNFIPEFTICGECYEDVVRPQQLDDNDIARNFHSKPHKLPVATCQLYSTRMRDIFKWACRRNDPEYLEERLRERRQIEEDLHAKFVYLTKDGRRNRWTEEQIEKLAREWRKWE